MIAGPHAERQPGIKAYIIGDGRGLRKPALFYRAQTSTSSTVAQRESPGSLLASCRPSGHWHSVALRGSPAVASDHSQCLSRAYCDANSGCHFSRRRFDDELSLTVRVTYSCHILLELSHPSCHIFFFISLPVFCITRPYVTIAPPSDPHPTGLFTFLRV